MKKVIKPLVLASMATFLISYVYGNQRDLNSSIDLNSSNVHSLQIKSTKAVDITVNSAYIEWSLSDYGTGQVEYGETSSYGNFNVKETSFNYKSHRQPLKGLKPHTTYHYRVISEDKNGHRVVSEDKTFETAYESAIMVYPYATNEEEFINKFPDALDTLKANGINTIHFVAGWRFYRAKEFNSSKYNYYYITGGGHRAKFFKKLAKITRDKKMKIVVLYNVLSHLEYDPLAKKYPELFIKYPEWKAGSEYKYNLWKANGGTFIEHNGKAYMLLKNKDHTSSYENEPGKDSKKWEEYWKLFHRGILNPLNDKAKKKRNEMLSEIIDAFTVDGVKPDGVNIGGDEAFTWGNLHCEDSSPNQCGGKTYAEVYGEQANETYEHIKSIDKNIDVYMWGDMLGENHNGHIIPTAKAIDIINKDIIIADWKYFNGYEIGYDKKSDQFKSVKEFADKGFRVLASGWRQKAAANSLVWSGKIVNQKSNKYIGYLNTVWTPDTFYKIIEGLNRVSNGNKAGEKVFSDEEVKELPNLKYTNGLVPSIIQAKKAQESKECSDVGEWTGTYPNCYDCNEKDGVYGDVYRDYSSENGTCSYKEIDIPKGNLSWDFSSESEGLELKNGAELKYTKERDWVLKLDGNNGSYAVTQKIPDINISSRLSLSMWFKLKEPIKPGTFQVLFSKDPTEYELAIFPNSMIGIYKTSGSGAKLPYEVVSMLTHISRKPWKVGKWYHILWIMDKEKNWVFLDGGIRAYNSASPGVISSNHKITIGGRAGSTNHTFNGEIDDVKLFNRPISIEEHQVLSAVKKDEQ